MRKNGSSRYQYRFDEQNINLVLKLFWDWEDWLYQEIRILELVNSQTVG